jgi:hypothetical protein
MQISHAIITTSSNICTTHAQRNTHKDSTATTISHMLSFSNLESTTRAAAARAMLIYIGISLFKQYPRQRGQIRDAFCERLPLISARAMLIAIDVSIFKQ